MQHCGRVENDCFRFVDGRCSCKCCGVCKCAEIMKADETRHFRGCPLREKHSTRVSREAAPPGAVEYKFSEGPNIFDEALKHTHYRRFIGPETPKIICLCGSTRFGKLYEMWNLRETMKGHIVLSVGCYTHSDAELQISDEEKWKLDELHKRKIEIADEILVLNAFACSRCKMTGEQLQGYEEKSCSSGAFPGPALPKHDVRPYIGDSTRSEIAHALNLGKPVRFLNPQGPESTVELSANGQPYGYGDVQTMMCRLGLGL